MTINLFFVANVKQLRTDGSFRILLPIFRAPWSVGVLNSAIFNSFHNCVHFGTILEGLRNIGGGGRVWVVSPNPPPVGTTLNPTKTGSSNFPNCLDALWKEKTAGRIYTRY